MEAQVNRSKLLLTTCFLGLAACTVEVDPGAGAAASSASTPLVPADREGKVALGLEHASAWALYEALRERAGGGQRLSPTDMPDWSGLWTRTGRPFFDPEQTFDQLTTAKLQPAALAELTHRRELSAQGIEYDPISDCSPPGHPRWLAIPLRAVLAKIDPQGPPGEEKK